MIPARIYNPVLLVLLLVCAGASSAEADGLLDGKAFAGMIGPAENPDLDDRLFFDDGHFWSDICTRCGFVPGLYEAEDTAEGVRFTGTLQSDSRGRFDYDGLVKEDGTIQATVTWERRRWYWTSRREISFIGETATGISGLSLSETLQAMQSVHPEGNPICARF